MSAGIVSATIRVTVLGDAGRVDLAVPTWIDVATLAAGYAEAVGTTGVPVLATTSGSVLDGDRSVDEVGLKHGHVVVALAHDDLAGISALVMVGLGAGALALVARSFRSTLPRLALRLSAAWTLAFLGLDVLREFGRTTDWVVFAVGGALALLVSLTAVSLGRGWRSVWCARVADLAEGLSIVLVVAAVPLASGFSEVVRGFTS